MAFWQPPRLTHALREIPEQSSSKAPGKCASSTPDASAGHSSLWGGRIFQGVLFSSQGFAFPYLPDHSSWPSPFMLWSPHLWLYGRGITENVTIINVPLQNPVLPVLSFLASDSAPL